MIDKAEVTFLLNTENSISKYADVYQQATYSPWIYSELVCTQLIRKKKISEYRQQGYLKHYNESKDENNVFFVAYDVTLDHFIEI